MQGLSQPNLRALLLIAIVLVVGAGLAARFFPSRNTAPMVTPATAPPAPTPTAWHAEALEGVALQPPLAGAEPMACPEVSLWDDYHI